MTEFGKDRLCKEIDEDKDSLRLYRLGNNYKEKVEHYGVKQSINVENPLIF